MAIYEQSYQPWSGTYGSRAGRIWAMVRLEITQPFKSVWVLIVILAAFALVMAWLLILFIAASNPAAEKATDFLLGGNHLYREGFYNFPASREHGIMLSLFSMILMFLSATVGSALVSRDLK